jgi:LytS/YehU family sensor histidine kinase
LYFLIPRFLEKGRYVSYVSLLLLTILCTAALIVTGYYVSAWWSDRTFQELYGVDPSNYLFFFKINTLPSTVASTTLAMSIKLTKNWIQSLKRQQLQEKERYETELKFLRSQFNPHFLFNTINSIFFLIHKNPVMASDSLAKFSDLLRYQLYECNEKQIPLSNEITYLENFIELEKLRQSNLEVSIEIDQQPKHHLAIAPFVLMTFTENAFKHVSSHKNRPNWIRLHLSLNGFQFRFNISNSMSSIKSNDVVSYGGIGLSNVKRRLDLIYPGQYQLNIQNDQNSFEVELSLHLSEISEPQPMKMKINKSA